MLAKDKHTSFIKSVARSLGFDYCGIAVAQPLDEDARRLESWLNSGFHGSMDYMSHYFDLRIDPGKTGSGRKVGDYIATQLFSFTRAKAGSSGDF